MKNHYQEKFGYPIPRTAGKVKAHIAPWIQDFIRHSPFCIGPRATPKGIAMHRRKAARLGLSKC